MSKGNKSRFQALEIQNFPEEHAPAPRWFVASLLNVCAHKLSPLATLLFIRLSFSYYNGVNSYMKSTKVKLYACKFMVVVVLIVVVNLQLLIRIDIDSSVRWFQGRGLSINWGGGVYSYIRVMPD